MTPINCYSRHINQCHASWTSASRLGWCGWWWYTRPKQHHNLSLHQRHSQRAWIGLSGVSWSVHQPRSHILITNILRPVFIPPQSYFMLMFKWAIYILVCIYRRWPRLTIKFSGIALRRQRYLVFIISHRAVVGICLRPLTIVPIFVSGIER